MTSKLQIAGMATIAAGAISLLLEKTFYDYVDENGVLQESFFLPLGVMLLFLGVVLFVVGVVWKWRSRQA